MITEEEKQEIIERVLLLIPEVVGNMMAQHAVLHKINKKFYSDYPEFKDHKDSVTSVVEMIEGKNPLDKYDELLKKAVPEIRKRINTLQNLDTSLVASRPKRNFNGEI